MGMAEMQVPPAGAREGPIARPQVRASNLLGILKVLIIMMVIATTVVIAVVTVMMKWPRWYLYRQ